MQLLNLRTLVGGDLDGIAGLRHGGVAALDVLDARHGGGVVNLLPFVVAHAGIGDHEAVVDRGGDIARVNAGDVPVEGQGVADDGIRHLHVVVFTDGMNPQGIVDLVGGGIVSARLVNRHLVGILMVDVDGGAVLKGHRGGRAVHRRRDIEGELGVVRGGQNIKGGVIRVPLDSKGMAALVIGNGIAIHGSVAGNVHVERAAEVVRQLQSRRHRILHFRIVVRELGAVVLRKLQLDIQLGILRKGDGIAAGDRGAILLGDGDARQQGIQVGGGLCGVVLRVGHAHGDDRAVVQCDGQRLIAGEGRQAAEQVIRRAHVHVGLVVIGDQTGHALHAHEMLVGEGHVRHVRHVQQRITIYNMKLFDQPGQQDLAVARDAVVHARRVEIHGEGEYGQAGGGKHDGVRALQVHIRPAFADVLHIHVLSADLRGLGGGVHSLKHVGLQRQVNHTHVRGFLRAQMLGNLILLEGNFDLDVAGGGLVLIPFAGRQTCLVRLLHHEGKVVQQRIRGGVLLLDRLLVQGVHVGVIVVSRAAGRHLLHLEVGVVRHVGGMAQPHHGLDVAILIFIDALVEYLGKMHAQGRVPGQLRGLGLALGVQPGVAPGAVRLAIGQAGQHGVTQHGVYIFIFIRIEGNGSGSQIIDGAGQLDLKPAADDVGLLSIVIGGDAHHDAGIVRTHREGHFDGQDFL